MGDWGKLKIASRSLASDIKKAETKALHKIALKAESTAKEYILSQPSSWQPLNPAYKARKTGRGRTRNDGGQDRRYKRKSGLMLIATSSYIQSITSKVDARVMVAYAGVTKKAVHKESKRPLVDIAKIHEFGSKARNIPARPVWQPTMKLVKKWIKDSRVLQKELKKQFNKYR